MHGNNNNIPDVPELLTYCYKWFQDNTTICLDAGDCENAFSTETQVALGKSGHNFNSTLFC